MTAPSDEPGNLPDFLASVAAGVGPVDAVHRGLQRMVEAFEADLVAVVRDHRLLAQKGPAATTVDQAEVEAVAAGQGSTIGIAGRGRVEAVSVWLEESRSVIVLARAQPTFTAEELDHARAMMRVFTLMMNLINKVHRNEGLLAEHRLNRSVLESILRVQRLISQRRPTQKILEAITAEAAEILGADLAGVYLHPPGQPMHRSLSAASPIGRAMCQDLSETEFLTIGRRATANELLTPVPFTIRSLPTGEGTALVAGAAVCDDNTPIGGLFVVLAARPNVTWQVATPAMETLASQASIALTDASTMTELENAFHDHLTGLPNRSLFHDRFEQTLEDGARAGNTIGLLFVDLDRFKSVNDTKGHAAGDALLQAVATELRLAVRESDGLARLGGDEFAIVLDNTTSTAAEQMANRLLDRVCEIVNPKSLPGRPGASIGVALSGPDCHTTDELLRRADIAMYRVKSTGRSGVAVYNPDMGPTRLDWNTISDGMRHGLEQDEFVLHYQPIQDLRTRRIDGFEALVRWQHPTRGLLAPDAFIHAAEETGMIIPLGRRVLDLACHQLAQWRRRIPQAADLAVSVNISARQLEHVSIQHDVQHALEESGLDPSALTLEITESILVDETDQARTTLQKLKDLGVKLAIDDFGTGYASLGYVHNYPFDVLKIDRTFVKGLGTSANGGAIIRTMMALAEQLGMTVVAEGIETSGELAQLRALRCPYGQGYLFSRPQEVDEIEQMLSDPTSPLLMQP